MMNNSDVDAQAEIVPDGKALGLTMPAVPVDACDEQAWDEKGVAIHAVAPTIPVVNGVVKFPVAKRNFRALVAR